MATQAVIDQVIQELRDQEGSTTRTEGNEDWHILVVLINILDRLEALEGP